MMYSCGGVMACAVTGAVDLRSARCTSSHATRAVSGERLRCRPCRAVGRMCAASAECPRWPGARGSLSELAVDI